MHKLLSSLVIAAAAIAHLSAGGDLREGQAETRIAVCSLVGSDGRFHIRKNSADIRPESNAGRTPEPG